MASVQRDEVRDGCNRVVDLARRGSDEQAIAESKALAERFPRRHEPRLQLGVLLMQSNDRDGAEKAFRECLAAAPTLEPALTLLGDLLLDKGDMAGALVCYGELVRSRPDDGRIWNSIAAASLAAGQLDEAEAAARRARTLQPESALAWLNLGRACAARGKHHDALAALNQSLHLDPEGADAHDLAGRLFAQAGRYTRAAKSFRNALDAGARAVTSSRLGEVLMQLGDVAGAVAAYRDAESQDPAHAAEHGSRALFALHADELANPATIFTAHRDWAARYIQDFPARPYRNSREPDRRLRVAYVSPRLRRASASFLLLPVLEHHDPVELEYICYAEHDVDDEISEQIRSRAGGWRNTRGLDDDALDLAIREDSIDIVVDLAGHTPGNRLAALARKPAPVALTWLDYFDTTGCETIDAIVTDPLHTPPGDAQPFVERPMRISPLRFCYAAPEYAPDISPPPTAGGAGIVFGGFHRFAKIGPAVVRAWSEILTRVPGSRLVIKNDALNDEGERDWHRDRLGAAGLPMARVELRGASAHAEMLGEYGGIDIALDAFPYNGGITTLEALWMGRPVMAMQGNTLISRQSAAILRSAGLGELVGATPGEMVSLAVQLAADRDRILSLASGLRARLAASPVCNASAFTRALESAYRAAWRNWCVGETIGDLP